MIIDGVVFVVGGMLKWQGASMQVKLRRGMERVREQQRRKSLAGVV